MSKFNPWTKDELERLQVLRAGGLTWTAIADRMPGRTYAACEQKYHAEVGTDVREFGAAPLMTTAEMVGIYKPHGGELAYRGR